MKKLLLTVCAASFIMFLFGGCEKDDICVDAVTPKLVIQFYDHNNFNDLKSVTLLRVIGEGEEEPVILNDNRATVTTTNEIAIPLKTLEDSSTFIFITNYGIDPDTGEEVGNRDTVTFNYLRNEIYVSRACGYKVNYSSLSRTLQADGDNWIKNIVIENTDVSDENTTHVFIYH